MTDRNHEHDHERWEDDVAAYALGALDSGETAEFEHHLEGCERCQAGIRWLMPAVNALPEAADPVKPPSSLRAKVLGEARKDAAEQARAAGSHAGAAGGWGQRLAGWLRGSGSHSVALRPLAGLAAVALIVAAVAGYAIGTGGSDQTGGESKIISGHAPGVVATVVRSDSGNSLQLRNVGPLPSNRVLEAWVRRDGEVQPVRALFVPDDEGRARTMLPGMKGVDAVMVTVEPSGGSDVPSSTPIATVAIPQ